MSTSVRCQLGSRPGFSRACPFRRNLLGSSHFGDVCLNAKTLVIKHSAPYHIDHCTYGSRAAPYPILGTLCSPVIFKLAVIHRLPGNPETNSIPAVMSSAKLLKVVQV